MFSQATAKSSVSQDSTEVTNIDDNQDSADFAPDGRELTDAEKGFFALYNAENAGTASSQAETTSSESSVWLFIKVILVLALVIVGIYAFVWILRKTSRVPDSKDSYLRHTASLAIGQGNSVHVVTIGDKGYLLGVSSSSVNLISEVEDKELVQAMNLVADARSDSNTSFSDLFSKMMPFLKKDVKKNRFKYETEQAEVTDDFSQEEFSGTGFAERQRQRFEEISNRNKGRLDE